MLNTVSTRAAATAAGAPVRPRLARTTPCMRRIDSLGWSDSLVLDVFGVRVGLRSDSTPLLRRAAARWTSVGAHVVTADETGTADVLVEGILSLHSGARDVTAAVRPPLTLYDGAARVIRSTDRDEVLDLVDTMVRISVADRSPTRLFVHAGVVAHRGQGILVVGGSMSGKTTLVRALLALGATYYSDDAAVIDDEGRVHPFAKPLAVRDSVDSVQRPVTPEALGARVGAGPLRAAVVAIARHHAGSAWRPRPLSGGAATLALLEHTGGVQNRPARTLAVLNRLLSGATVLRGPRGDADACARQLVRALDRRCGAASAAEHVA